MSGERAKQTGFIYGCDTLLKRAGVIEEVEGPDSRHHYRVVAWRIGAMFTSPSVTVIPVFRPDFRAAAMDIELKGSIDKGLFF